MKDCMSTSGPTLYVEEVFFLCVFDSGIYLQFILHYFGSGLDIVCHGHKF